MMITPEQLQSLVPDVQTFFIALEASRTAYNEAVADVGGRGTDAYYDNVDALREDRDGAIQAAWDELAKSDHKLAAWIAKNCQDYESQSLAVLALLTPDVTLAVLDELARDKNWCYVWGDFRAKAVAAGAVDLEGQIRMRVNGGPWQPFWQHQTDDGSVPFSASMLGKLFGQGVSTLSAQVGRDHLMFEIGGSPVLQ